MKRLNKSEMSSGSQRALLVGQQLLEHKVKKTHLKQNQKQQRALYRQEMYHGHAVNMNPEMGPTFLERRPVSAAREESYKQAWARLETALPYCNLHRISLPELDMKVTAHINNMFSEGHTLADVHTLLAAVKFIRPDVKKVQDLTRSSKAARGFKKLAPPMGRVPIPYPCLAKIVQFLISKGEWMVGFWMLLTWAVCARPGETLKLLWKHLIPSSRLQSQWMVVLSAPDACGAARPSKVGEMDENVILDQPYLSWLGSALSRMRGTAPIMSPIFTFPMSFAAQKFHSAVVALKYQEIGITCSYQIRHGSASTDQMQKLRSLHDTMKRGRWKSIGSIRRYVNGGRVAEIFDSLTTDQQDSAMAAEEMIPKMLARLPCKPQTKVVS